MKWLFLAGAILMSLPLIAGELDPKTCRVVEVEAGPEDIELDRWSTPPRLIVGSTPPVAVPIVDGMLGEKVALQTPKFHPIGISLVRTGDKTLLYAISKGVGVEVFELSGNALIPLPFPDGKLTSKLITTPNGIAATRSGEIYVSNMSAHGGIRGRLSNVFRANNGNVIHYRDGKWMTEISPVRFGNGLLLSPDESQLWVAAFGDRKIHRFRRDTGAGTLTHEVTIGLEAYPDNIKWSTFPELVAAVHPSYWRIGLHVTLPKVFHSRSAVAMIRDATAAAPAAEIVLEHGSGKVISGASTAIVQGRRVFLSQIKRSFLVDCPAPEGLTKE